MMAATSSLRLHSSQREDALPWNSSRALQDILDRLATLRFTHFLALQAELLSLHADLCQHSDFLEQATAVACLADDERQALINHPVFRAWTALTLRELNLLFIRRTQDTQPLADLLAEFPRMTDRVRVELAKGPGPRFFRLDLDPLLVRVLPPSYDMPTDSAAIVAARQAGHPLGFFRDVVGVALERIEACWPFARTLVDELVSSIAYLPDGNFRSCSASRYTGLILVSARDASILDLEESLVHEAGHQLLYAMNEIAPICTEGAGGNYKLPWSTQVRDIYGYFHALFIYVILARYLERVLALRQDDEVRRAAQRLAHIVGGLVAALPDLEADTELTDAGRSLLTLLRREIGAIAKRQCQLVP